VNNENVSGVIDSLIGFVIIGFILWLIIRYIRGFREDHKNKKSAQARYDLSKAEVERRRSKGTGVQNADDEIVQPLETATTTNTSKRRYKKRTIFGVVALVLSLLYVVGFIAESRVAKNGRDCNVKALEKIVEVGKGTEAPLNPGNEAELIKSANAYQRYRLHISGLDLPLIANEQVAYVDALGDFVEELLRYIASDGDSYAVNKAALALGDVSVDFKTAFKSECL
jgi:hypothetical protein